MEVFRQTEVENLDTPPGIIVRYRHNIAAQDDQVQAGSALKETSITRRDRRRDCPGVVQQTRTKATRAYDEYVDQYIGLLPLVAYFKGAIQKYLPEYWEQQVVVAKGNGHMRLWADLYEPGPALDKMLETIHKDNAELRAALSPIFSTLTINKSAIFRSHADAKNEGGLACLAAFGRFIGGDLCLPRLRVAFNLKPGDILICDNNREQHGNIGPLTGTRISVVCYLRAMEKTKAARGAI